MDKIFEVIWEYSKKEGMILLQNKKISQFRLNKQFAQVRFGTLVYTFYRLPVQCFTSTCL